MSKYTVSIASLLSSHFSGKIDLTKLAEDSDEDCEPGLTPDRLAEICEVLTRKLQISEEPLDEIFMGVFSQIEGFHVLVEKGMKDLALSSGSVELRAAVEEYEEAKKEYLTKLN